MKLVMIPDIERRYTLYVISTVLGLFCLNIARSQQIPLYSGMQYKHCYVHHDSPISESPPYSTSMPLEVFQTYFVLDSLAKSTFSTNPRVLAKRIEDTLTIDNLDSLLKYAYQSIDYDPVRFLSYLSVGDYLQPAYNNRPTTFFYLYRLLAIKKLGGVDNPVLYLTFAHGIYDIEITNVTIDSVATGYRGGDTQYEEVVCITAKVLEALKGASIVEQCDALEGDAYQCIRFSFGRNWAIGPSHSSDNRVTGIITTDTNKVEKTHRNSFKTYGDMSLPSVGDRYIVFLEVDLGSKRDDEGMPFNLFPMRIWEQQGGLFPVIQGNVVDESDYFGFGESIDVGTFKGNIYDLVENSILNR